MKIKATQLDKITRDTIASAVTYWCKSIEDFIPVISNEYMDIAQTIKHGELILCEYQYNEQKEGGE